MKHVKTIGIVGAGLSGLVAAKTCLEYGYSVLIFEKEKELGGVWASSRRYPGIETQNTKDTYCFSDFPMPKRFPEWPRGEQVQSYLLHYAKNFGVLPFVHFSHQVTSLNFQNNQWIIHGKHGAGDFTYQTDFLLVCNGTFSEPFIPEIPGMDSFVQAGGQILHSTEFNTTDMAADKRIAVVGYGKSATDLVTLASEAARSSIMIFREAKWKIPRYVKGINMKYLLLNRLGESFIKPPDQHNKIDRFVHRSGMANKMLSFMQGYITKKQMLKELNLLPDVGIKEQAFGEIALETPSFFEKVKNGKIIPKKGEIISFNGKKMTLSGGEQIECDLVVFAVGFKQTIPFLGDDLKRKLTDKDGNYILYRHILPAGIPSLAFVGYNSSIQTPLSAEFGALWVCEYLKERIAKPSEEQIIREGTEFIRWRSQRNGSSCGPVAERYECRSPLLFVDTRLASNNQPGTL